ncbi:hypothetical protein CDAR_571991 [Caerostris darwini]|uniref:Uncharacterized protein n=1 Tax=Caerostris darwini TaxID=1538125 RepID=A0AAV4Q722_9ARAC|nr:hypothetical protein CDAR_571991 [Caerostris darwini]
MHPHNTLNHYKFLISPTRAHRGNLLIHRVIRTIAHTESTRHALGPLVRLAPSGNTVPESRGNKFDETARRLIQVTVSIIAITSTSS